MRKLPSIIGVKMSIIETSKTYYPQYPQLVELVEKHEKVHWGTWEVSLKDDLVQWQSGLIDEENKAFIKIEIIKTKKICH